MPVAGESCGLAANAQPPRLAHFEGLQEEPETQVPHLQQRDDQVPDREDDQDGLAHTHDLG